MFDIPLQLVIGRLKLGDRLLEFFRHTVKMITQLTDLILASAGIPDIKIKVCHPFGQACQLSDGAGDPF